MKSMPKESIDLIYIDPPFGTQSLRQSKAFKEKVQEFKFYDKWNSGKPGPDGYINFMVERLRQMHRLLKPTGSLFVHLDWRMAHYIKIELDKIFGVKNPAASNTSFINEIIWHYTGGGRSKSGLSKKHDTILWYSKENKKHVFNIDKVRVPYKETSGYAKAGIVSKSGKKYLPNPLGTPVDDVWNIPIINPLSKERTGWPTQKPLKLLSRIIEMASKPGDLVADFFCGCGTAIVAAQRLNRKWIGIDISAEAIKLTKERLKNAQTNTGKAV